MGTPQRTVLKISHFHLFCSAFSIFARRTRSMILSYIWSIFQSGGHHKTCQPEPIGREQITPLLGIQHLLVWVENIERHWISWPSLSSTHTHRSAFNYTYSPIYMRSSHLCSEHKWKETELHNFWENELKSNPIQNSYFDGGPNNRGQMWWCESQVILDFLRYVADLKLRNVHLPMLFKRSVALSD